MLIAEPLEIAIRQLSRLPGIGKKSALRLALFLLRQKSEDVQGLVDAILKLQTDIKFCTNCFNLSTAELCSVCQSLTRDRSIICVVEEINDVIAIEKTNEYKGLYHILGGVLSPLDGIGSEQLKIKELVNRVEKEKPSEIILAMNPSTEGETTALYLAKIMNRHNLKISRIARGLPIGSDLEFVDEATISRALEGRLILK